MHMLCLHTLQNQMLFKLNNLKVLYKRGKSLSFRCDIAVYIQDNVWWRRKTKNKAPLDCILALGWQKGHGDHYAYVESYLLYGWTPLRLC